MCLHLLSTSQALYVVPYLVIITHTHIHIYNQYNQCTRNHGLFIMTESKSSKSSGEKCHIWGLAVVSGYGGNFTLIYDTLWSHG